MAENNNNNKFSRRQRLFDLVKNTKDVYIPSLSSTITQLASEATNKALNYNDTDPAIPNKNYHGAQILLYPHFTRQGEDGTDFYTQIHGWVYASDGSSRKKRIVLSLARQLCKSNNAIVSDATAGQLDEQIDSIQDQSDSDTTSLASSQASSFSSSSRQQQSGSAVKRSGTTSSTGSFGDVPSSANSDTDEVLKERIANFVNRSIGNLELNIAIGGSNRDDLKTLKILSDNNGNFNLDVVTNFKPSYVQVAVSEDEKIFEFKEVLYPGENKYAIISDIDDTIKVTGVCGDKRSVFRNTFADDMSTWEVPGVADWFRFLHQRHDVSFFYVSNSPYQLYSNLMKFFKMFDFPPGAIYLKRYTGNILNSFMEPSHARKKVPLERIFGHFSSKKFFLIGDTSEQDLEAYVDIARLHPENVAGIFLRVAPNSINVDTLKLILDILNKRNLSENDRAFVEKIEKVKKEENLIDLGEEDDIVSKEKLSHQNLQKLEQESEAKSEKVVRNLIDLEEGSDDFVNKQNEAKRKPPKIPNKPRSLRTTVEKQPSSRSSASSASNVSVDGPPTLPKRPVPTPPPRSKLSSLTSKTLTAAKSFNEEVPFNEETNDEWISRILTSLIVLKKAGGIKLKLYNDIDEIHDDIQSVLQREDNSTDN